MSNLDSSAIKKAPTPEDGIELYEIDCHINVKNLSAILFRGLPYFVKSSKCSSGCILQDRQLTSLLCNCDNFFEKDVAKAIFAVENVPCRKQKCKGIVTRTFTASVNYILVWIESI